MATVLIWGQSIRVYALIDQIHAEVPGWEVEHPSDIRTAQDRILFPRQPTWRVLAGRYELTPQTIDTRGNLGSRQLPTVTLVVVDVSSEHRDVTEIRHAARASGVEPILIDPMDIGQRQQIIQQLKEADAIS